ncbi:MAG: glycosyltransferase family 4 protein [Prevotella sp.]|nr:glycosyltransferase family 4 protein [Prevotella sp.]
MKKIAYISVPHFADCDAPLIHHLQEKDDIIYLIKVSDDTKKYTLLNIDRLKKHGSVVPATEYKGMEAIGKFVDLSKTFIVNMPSTKNYSPSNIWVIFKLLLFLLKRHVDVVHITSPLNLGELCLYFLRKRMLLTVHDPLSHSSNNDLRNKIHRGLAFRLLSHFLILNQSQRAAFISNYHLEKKHVYNSQLSIYTHLLSTTPHYPTSQGYVLFFGSISSYKGIDVLCEAMKKVHASRPDAKLIIAGKGTIYFDITPYMEAGFLELHNRYITTEELVGFIRNAAFVVCPYIDATQSGVIMSAFALNTPVIATNVGGLSEMVADGRHGLIIPPKDSEALSQAIETLFTDTELFEKMRKNIAEDYTHGSRSWDSISKGISHIYSQIE